MKIAVLRTFSSRAASLAQRSSCNVRLYHSYPDPSEKAVASRFIAKTSKKIDKSKLPFPPVSDSFRVDEREVFPGTEVQTKFTAVDNTGPQTLSTILPNGITVASQDTYSLMTSLAVIFKTGSSFEIQTGPDAETGVTQLLELSAFQSTQTRSRAQMSADIERIGGMVQTISASDNIIYCIDALRDQTETAVDLLADTILSPTFPQEELDESKVVVQMQRDQSPANVLSKDAVRLAAFSQIPGNPLGNHHFSPSDDTLDLITPQALHRFRDAILYGSNCVFVGSGIDHQTLVGLVEKKMQALPAVPRAPRIPKPPSEYTGGLYVNERELKDPYNKVCMAFKIGGYHSDKFVTACVLQQLLGGGSSFSAGGPGKGMYSRLYLQMLNKFRWVESAEAMLTVYDDCGIFGIDGACPPTFEQNMIIEILNQFLLLATERVSDEELNRAKNMIKSTILMQLESRLINCEDIARQFATYGERRSASVTCDKISKVTAEDIQQLAIEMVMSPPSVGVVGTSLDNFPNYDQIRTYVEDTTVAAFKSKLPQRAV